MKKFLLALSSVFLFAASLSAQTSPALTAAMVLPDNESVFGRDIMSTIKFDTVLTKLNQPFDSANHNFVSANFDGHDGMFVFDTSNSAHSNHVFTTNDGSGFVIMDSEAMGDDTQRVTLTSPVFNTNGLNTAKVLINHHYKYSANDSAANLLISTNGTTWNLLHSFSAAAVDRGVSTAFVTDTFVLGNQYLNKNTVYLALVYATDSGYQWAVNDIKVMGNQYDYTYSFFRKNMSSMNVEWDLSDAVYDGNFKAYVRKAAPAPYRFIDSIYNEDLEGLMHTTYSQNYFTTDGIIAQAHLTYAQKISLQPVTGNLDTLTIPTQFVLQYSGLHTKVLYPMQYNFGSPANSTKWSSDFTFSGVFYLTGFGIPSPQFISAKRDTRIIEKDTVIGYGKMKLFADGSSFNNVWQVKVDYTQIDSFYCTDVDVAKKNAFNNFMANNSGLSTPNVQHYSMIHYYREKALHPFVTVYLQDTFITKIETNLAQPWPMDVAAVETATDDISVYPNPVTDKVVHIAIANPKDGQWNCDILNPVGQYLSRQQLNIDKANGNAVVNLPASLASGLYYLHLSKNGQTVTVKPIQVQ